ncbi:MAG: ATP-grasp domain-containing protein, partial [Dehalococcoidales bacterium]|nr:ATP-grasp domain-containing protein [Dehalococcoidales bacterium]
MCRKIALVYNEPMSGRFDLTNETMAVVSVLEAVHAVENALNELKYEVTLVPLCPPVSELRKSIESLDTDLIFNLFEGFDDCSETEALVPEIADELHIPYTGCPGKPLRLALDKAGAKAILKSAGIKTPDYQVLTPETVSNFNLTYPCIIKPRSEDASHGLSGKSVVYDYDSLVNQVKYICNLFGGNALVEEFVDGREFNASAFGNEDLLVLPISEIVFALPSDLPKVLTFDAKWNKDSLYFTGTTAVCPADINNATRQAIAQTVLKVFRLFDCTGYARVDMRLDG